MLKTGLSVTKDGGGIYAKNANFCTFVNLRTERHNVPLKMVFNGSSFNVDRDVAFDKNYGEKKVDLKDYYYTGINRKYAIIIQEFHGGFNSKESAFTISDHNYYYIVGDSSVRLQMVFTKDINGNDIPETNEGQAAQKPVFNFYINATRTFWQTVQNRTYWQFCIPEDVSECIVWAESGNLNIYKSDYELSL